MQLSNKKEKTLRKQMTVILLSPRLDCDKCINIYLHHGKSGNSQNSDW